VRAVLDISLFNTSSTSQTALLTIFGFGAEGRHVIELDPQAQSAFDTWLAQHSPAVQDEVQLALRFSAQISLRNPTDNLISVTDVVKPDWTNDPPLLPLLAARDLLSQPLGILVENAYNDGNFLRAVAPSIHRDPLERMITQGWIRFEQGGGIDEILNWVERKRNQPEIVKRHWVVFDADALAPERPSIKALKVERKCKGRLKFHRLERRTAENYIPPFVLVDLVQAPEDKAKAALVMLRRMSPSGRAHFNMKAGFDGDAHRPTEDDSASKAEVDTIFAGLQPVDRECLRTGFGPLIRDLFKKRHAFTPDRLRFDGQSGEMDALFQSILRWA
jgi:hypothetical protein